MGYFNRKLRRSAAGRAARDLERGTAAVRWPRATARPPPAGFVRLATADGSLGLFGAAYACRDSPDADATDRATLDEQLERFARELRPHRPRASTAVFWFRSTASDHVRRAWIMVNVLQRCGFDLRMLVHQRPPGRVVYSDAFQVAASPTASCRPRVKQLPLDK